MEPAKTISEQSPPSWDKWSVRGEELRRKIREKEIELDTISKKNQIIKSQLGADRYSYHDFSTEQRPSKLSDSFREPSRNDYRPEPSRNNYKLEPSRHDFKPEPSRYDFKLEPSRHEFKPEPSRYDFKPEPSAEEGQLKRRLTLVSNELQRVLSERQQLQDQCLAVESQIQSLTNELRLQEQSTNHDQLKLQQEIDSSKKHQQLLKQQIEQFVNQQTQIMQALEEQQFKNEHSPLQEVQQQLQLKVAQIKGLERDNYDQLQHQEMLEQQLEQRERQLDLDLRKLTQTSTKSQQLHFECHSLHTKTEQLKATYEETVLAIDEEQAILIESNRYQVKLIASKDIFLTLGRVLVARKLLVYQDIMSYCHFDKYCQGVLLKFRDHLEHVGEQRLRQSLLLWFQHCFQVIQTKSQVEESLARSARQKTVGNVLNQWTNQMFNNQLMYRTKLDSAKTIFWIKQKDVVKDIHRYFTIWKESNRFGCNKVAKLRKLASQWRLRKLWIGFQGFKLVSQSEELEVRHLIRIRAHCQLQYLHRLWEALRHQTKTQRQTRLDKLKHLWKCLQDGVTYYKHIKKAKRQVDRLKKECVTHTLQSCFSQLRLHKELSKCEVMTNELSGLPNDDYHEQAHQMSYKLLKQQKQRAISCINVLGLKLIRSYFGQWVRVRQAYYREMQGLARLLRVKAKRMMHTALMVWMVKANCQANQQVQECLGQLHQDNIQLTQLCTQEHRKIIYDSDTHTAMTKKVLTRVVYQWLYRKIGYAVRLWQNRVKQYNLNQAAAQFIVKRTAKNHLQLIFRKWQKIRILQQSSTKADNRCTYYLGVRQDRLIRTVFSAVFAYNHKNKKARIRLSRIITKCDYQATKHAFHKWRWIASEQIVDQYKQQQNQQTEVFGDWNSQLGSVVKLYSDHQQLNTHLQTNLVHQGQRVLRNYFQKFYYSKAERGFRKWQTVVQQQKHREQYLKWLINHQRKARLYVVKSAFANWIGQSKVIELKGQIRHTALEIDETVRTQLVRRKEHEQLVEDMQTELGQKQEMPFVATRDKLIQNIVSRQQRCYYTSRLRYIFTAWQAHTKRAVKFISQISNALRKSMVQNGFTNIARFSRDRLITRLQNRVLVGMTRMRQKKMLANAMYQMWHYFNAVNKKTYRLTYESQIQKAKDQKIFAANHYAVQLENAYKTKMQNQLRNYWKGWRNVHKWQSAMKQATARYKSNMFSNQVRQALYRWNVRTVVSLKLRRLVKVVKEIDRQVYLKNYWDRLRLKSKREYHFFMLLANASNKYNSQQKDRAFNLISLVCKRKKEVHAKQKIVTTKEIFRQLEFLVYKRKVQVLSDLRTFGKRKQSVSAILRRIRLFQGRNLRHVFNMWQQKKKEREVVDDVETNGPVVDEQFEQQLILKTYSSFLKDEKYTPIEIQEIKDTTENLVQDRMIRVVRRMQHQDGGDRLKPWVFERWKEFVKMRRLVRYLLNKIILRLRPDTNLMHRAFCVWRSLTARDGINLKRITIQQLTVKAKEVMAKAIELQVYQRQSGELKQQLQIQRDELIEKYISAQKLALALGRDNREKTLWHGMSQLQTFRHNKNLGGYQQILEANLQMIENLKEKIADYETENEQLAAENEELRLFSLSGIKLAKDAKELEQQRRLLSVDLADQSQNLKELLVQNQKLKLQLQQLNY